MSTILHEEDILADTLSWLRKAPVAVPKPAHTPVPSRNPTRHRQFDTSH